jgi:thymidine phosphorylase
VGSILSKKLAAGVRRLVLDVKTGSGAFMQRRDDARALASALVRVAQGAGLECTALVTAMDRPLGDAVGNALEVAEAVETLKGRGPRDLVELTLALADHPDAARVLASGAAYARWRRMVEAQGGDPDADLLGGGCERIEVRSERSGFLVRADARGIGRAAFVLGAGRRRAEEAVDFGVGLVLARKPGDAVRAGETLAVVHHRGRAVDEALALVRDALRVGDAPPDDVPPLVLERIAR